MTSSRCCPNYSTVLSQILAAVQAQGELVVSDIASVIPGTGTSNLGKVHDAALVEGASVGVFALAVRNDANAVINNTDLGFGAISVSSSGAVKIDATVTAAAITSVIPGVGPTNLGKAEDQAAVSGDTGVAFLAVQTATPVSTASDGDYVWLKTDALGKLWTTGSYKEDTLHVADDIGHFVLAVRRDTPASSSAVDGEYVSLNCSSIGSLYTQSQLAADADSFNAVSPADITNTTSTAIYAAGAGAVRHYVTSITVSNMHATVGTRVDLLDGATVIWSGPAAANGGGVSATFPQPLRGTAATALNLQCATTGTAVRGAIAGFNRSY